jgi:SAM-dependent methyltransferase
MEQTPIHEGYNNNLMDMIPRDAKKIIEIGSSSGAIAREFKKINPSCNYIGYEVDQKYVEFSKRYCDEAYLLNIDDAREDFFNQYKDVDCWVFGDVLEHLKDPWKVLSSIRKVIPQNGCVVACIPNIQHWSILVKLAIGDWRYEDSGLLDRTHLRFFTRQTIIEMFDSCGFSISKGEARYFENILPGREDFMPMIRAIAEKAKCDPNMAETDSTVFQYVVKAIPKN